MRRTTRIFLLMTGLFSIVAHAQLPTVQVPELQLPDVGPVLPGATRALDETLRELSAARTLRVERLIREHRAELDRDPRGELVVRAEVVAIDLTPAALDRAVAAKFTVLRTQEMGDLGIHITILQTPAGMSASRGLKRLRKLDPEGTYDYNHVYLDGGVAQPASEEFRPVKNEPAGGAAASRGRIGLIDGGLGDHVALKQLRVQRFGCEGTVVPSVHGTAVASLLASRGTITELLAADVYCGEPTGGAVDTVAAAFGWMAREKVAVINVSLVGPRNLLLERAVSALLGRGHVIVAAVGNDGPAAAPLFPAAYEGVVGVTAVDSKHRVLIEACRGNQVDFAALGAGVSAASTAPDQFAAVRGTSFAAPLVAALLAELRTPDVGLREQLLGKLAARAQDLGKPGRDDVYGAGELVSDK